MLTLTVPGVLESITAVSTFAGEAAAAAGLDSRAAYQLRLAVVELVTNTIVHGYQEANRTGNVELRAEVDSRTLEVTLEDTAIPYDPSQTPEPDLSLPLEERPLGGLGVYLALQYLHSYRYERVGDRNRSVLVINRPAP
jgi:anti-sigma regulatory factor (Ser/Thr protein kinase)